MLVLGVDRRNLVFKLVAWLDLDVDDALLLLHQVAVAQIPLAAARPAAMALAGRVVVWHYQAFVLEFGLEVLELFHFSAAPTILL